MEENLAKIFGIYEKLGLKPEEARSSKRPIIIKVPQEDQNPKLRGKDSLTPSNSRSSNSSSNSISSNSVS